jgi:hypothetical protein
MQLRGHTECLSVIKIIEPLQVLEIQHFFVLMFCYLLKHSHIMEPTLILSIIGFVLTLTKFITDQTAYVRQKYHDASHIVKLYQGYFFRLQECRATLQIWQRVWLLNDKASLSLCEHFWGKPVSDEIAQRLKETTELCFEVSLALMFECSERKRWHEILVMYRKHRTQPSEPGRTEAWRRVRQKGAATTRRGSRSRHTSRLGPHQDYWHHHHQQYLDNRPSTDSEIQTRLHGDGIRRNHQQDGNDVRIHREMTEVVERMSKDPETWLKSEFTTVQRLEFTGWNKIEIENLLSTLRQEVQGLESFALDSFCHRHHVPKHGDVEQHRKYAEVLHGIKTSASAIFEESRRMRDSEEWNFELSLPRLTLQSANFWSIVDNSQLRFTIREPVQAVPMTNMEQVARVWFVGSPMPHPRGAKLRSLGDVVKEGMLRKPFSLQVSIDGSHYRVVHDLTVHERAMPLREKLQKRKWAEVAKDCHEIAISATVWSVAAWQSGWLADICTCRIYNHKCNPTLTVGDTNQKTGRYHILRPRPTNDNNHDCPVTYSEGNKLFALGVILSEMILEKPIQLQIEENNLIFETYRYDVRNGKICKIRTKMNENGLVDCVARRSIPEMGEVVRCCLQFQDDYYENFQELVQKLPREILPP